MSPTLEEGPGPRPRGGLVGSSTQPTFTERLPCAPHLAPGQSAWARPSHLPVRATQPTPRGNREGPLLPRGGPLPSCSPELGGRGRGLQGARPRLRESGQHGREVQHEQLHLGVPNTAEVTSHPLSVRSPPPVRRMLQGRVRVETPVVVVPRGGDPA